ncbi:MAG: hypothetical protein JO358_06495, partial [Alphaproteobacteria bacterium]|nr:hypothetical protein [Alphaproteobacteria bacterium]
MMGNTSLALAGSLLFFANIANAQQSPPADDAAYTKLVMTAAPEQLVREATIVRMEANGTMRTLKKGSNEYTCMVANDVPMCADPNAMEWAHAWQTHAPQPDKVGFIYMLNGDNG